MCWKKRIKQKRERERVVSERAALSALSSWNFVNLSGRVPPLVPFPSSFFFTFLSSLPPLLSASLHRVNWMNSPGWSVDRAHSKKKKEENGEIGRERQRWAGTRRNPCRPWRSSAKRMRMRRGSECAEGIRTGCSGWPIRASSSSPSASKTSSRASSSPTSSARRRQWNVTLNSTRKLSVSPF